MTRNAERHFSTQHSRLLLAVSLDPREVGRRIAGARDAKGWTQLAFALAADVSPSTIQRWEAGKLPPVRELLRVAELLEVEPDTLVEPPESSGRPQIDLLRELATGLSEIAETEKELLERVRDIQERVSRLEGQQEKPAASPA
jgi:transcriptional regulator with XRE-family HTH domain